MARRSFAPTGSAKGALVDLRTGQPAASGATPLCQNIRRYRELREMDQKALAARIGVTANAISNWETGRTRPDVELLPLLAQALRVSLNDLYGLPRPASSATPEETRLVKAYRKLNPGHQQAVRSLVASLEAAEQAVEMPKLQVLQRFSRRLCAGIGDPTEFLDAGEALYVHADAIPRADCVFTVSGDSMEPAYHDGDQVLVQRDNRIAAGETGAFIVGNELYIKVSQPDGLHSLNPAYAPLRFADEPVLLIGRVVGTLRESDIADDAEIRQYEALTADPLAH